MIATLEKRAVVISPVEHQTLGAILNRLDIPIYPTDQVEAFKAEFRRRVVVKNTVTLLLWGIFYTAGWLSYVWVMSVLPYASSSPLMTPVLFVGEVISFVVYLICSFISPILLIAAARCHRDVKWERCGIGRGYLTAKTVPESELDLVRQIQKQDRDILCHVEYLEKDPFLWAKRGEEEYCIAHWDEPFTDK